MPIRPMAQAFARKRRAAARAAVRGRRRVARGRMRSVKKMVQRMIRGNAETKYVATNVDISGTNLGPLWPVKPTWTQFGDAKPAVPLLTLGPGDYQRIGSKIQPVSLAVSVKVVFNAFDLSCNALMGVIYYGTDKANKTFQGGNFPLQTTNILDNGDGTNKQWTGLLSDLNIPTDKHLFNLKRKVFRLAKTEGNLNTDVGGAAAGGYSTSNGLSEYSTVLRFKPPKTLLYNNDTDTYPSNYGPFYYIGFCHADGSALTAQDTKLVYASTRVHMYYKDS